MYNLSRSLLSKKPISHQSQTLLSPPPANLKSSTISTSGPPIAGPPQILPVLLYCGFAFLYCGFSVVFVMLYLFAFGVHLSSRDSVCATFDLKES